jgi:hypothetical protein
MMTYPITPSPVGKVFSLRVVDTPLKISLCELPTVGKFLSQIGYASSIMGKFERGELGDEVAL